MKNMIRSVLAALMGVSPAMANTHTWTGSGDGTTLSLNTNWEGDVAPVAGDRISIPSTKTVRVTAAADANLLVSLAGADLNGVLEIANYAATVTLPSTFTLSGSGAFRVLSITKIEFKGDNSSYTGSFLTSNTIVSVQHNRALGIACPVTHYVTANNKLLYINADGVYDNPVTLYQVSDSNQYFSYQTSCAVTNRGDFTLYSPKSNNFCNRFAGDNTKPLVFTGNVTMNSGFLDCTGNVRFEGSGSTVASVARIMCDSGKLSIGRTLLPENINEIRANGGGTVSFLATNVLNGCKLGLLNLSTGMVDLNGFDQTAGVLDTSASSADRSACIHSAAPATLTVTGNPVDSRYGGYITGAASLTFDSSGKTMTITNSAAKPSTTIGALTAKAGTLALGKGTKFTALGKLVVDGGALSVAAGASVNSSVRLVVTSNGGTLSVAEDAELTVQTARVNGGFAPAAVYTAASAGPFAGILSGGGTLRVVSDMEPIDDSPVFTWIGGTDTSLSTDANWLDGHAPTFGGSETVIFKENNGTANVSGTIKVYALKFDGAGTFTLTGDANAMIDVAYDGVTVTNSASAAAFAVTIAPSLRVLTDQTWIVPINDSLTLSSELRAASTLTTANTVTGIGQGQLHLLADNSAFLPKFDFKSRFSVRTTNGKGLGSPLRAVSCNGKIPYFYGGKALTNDVPFILTDISYLDSRDQIDATDTPLVQRGHIAFADTSAGTRYIAFYANGSIEGGVSSPNGSNNALWLRAMSADVCVKIEKKPIENISTLIPDQVGWFEISSTNNTFRALRVNKTYVCCTVEGVIPPTAPLRFGQTNNGPSVRPPWGSFHGALDLCGFSQTVNGIEMTGKVQGAQAGQGIVTSSVPASVVVTGVHTNDNLVLKFLGAAGCTLDAVGSLMAFSNGVSSTTGDLCVSNGEMRLDAGFVWGGSNTVTVAGGTLKVTEGAAASAFGGNDSLTKMCLSDGGILDLPLGTTVTVQKLCVDGQEVPAGIYCGVDGTANKRYAAHFGAGTGSLRVRKSDIGGTLILFQ